MDRNYFRQGEHLVWMTGAALSVTLLISLTLIAVVMANGLGFFWPARLVVARLHDGSALMGEVWEEQKGASGEPLRYKFKVGNRDLYGLDFRWVDAAAIDRIDQPDDAATLERREFGNFQGFLVGLAVEGLGLPEGGEPWARLRAALRLVAGRRGAIDERRNALFGVTRRMESIRLGLLRLRYEGEARNRERIEALEEAGRQARGEFDTLNEAFSALVAEQQRFTATFREVGGREKEIPIVDIVRAYLPNRMSIGAKAVHYVEKIGELVWAEPRESNTEGGLFPAIFGTVMLVISMSLFCIPLGVVAAVYLREYAKEGLLVRLVRIAVYNLAGVPSIVFGIFGLGFFIYGVGGTIDRLFFPERLPTATFGTGGLLWASLTLALLTVPVVIVATEEALAAIPKGIREASLSLGATQFQTLYRVLLPIATPGIVTGFVLAMARAAGEVAPLMITGVVKLAPTLPIDGQFPWLHLDRKFMHLGFHIYDVGFQSPNVEAAKPMVFMTTLLLVLIVLALSMMAILLRNKMQKRFATKTF